MNDRHPRVIIVGAGPAGLTAAYELAKRGQPVLVLEKDSHYVGGIARTVQYRGFRMDVGGHRFFSKSQVVEDLWSELLGGDMLRRARQSRIYYRGQFYSYPLAPLEALRKLGLSEAILCVLSYLKAQLPPRRTPQSYEDWVVGHFGQRLFQTFFQSYTEKIWGMSCREISADWAAQRIKGLSLGAAIRAALYSHRQSRRSAAVVKSLIDSFRYPRLGPGMAWDACAAKIRSMGGEIRLGCRVERCQFCPADASWTVFVRMENGEVEEYSAKHLVSSMPIQELVSQLHPQLPEHAIRSGKSLRYRDFLTVGLILHDRRPLSDQWIYIHDPDVRVGRIQNYKRWSPEMVPDESYACYGMEYFCFEGDDLWDRSEEDILSLAKKELIQLGLASMEDVVDGCVIRQPKAYPVYDHEYKRNVETVRRALDAVYSNIHLIGRNGMHKYNNQDHAMMTGLLTARNILANNRLFDVWSVNEDAEYLESRPS